MKWNSFLIFRSKGKSKMRTNSILVLNPHIISTNRVRVFYSNHIHTLKIVGCHGSYSLSLVDIYVRCFIFLERSIVTFDRSISFRFMITNHCISRNFLYFVVRFDSMCHSAILGSNFTLCWVAKHIELEISRSVEGLDISDYFAKTNISNSKERIWRLTMKVPHNILKNHSKTEGSERF
jgi:hypothetical protein